LENEAHPGDEELWGSYVGGDDAALDALTDRYRDELFWYLLLSTGQQRAAAQHSMNVWETLARYRRGFEAFGSFRGWLYAVATQNAVPAAHPESLGLSDLIEDMRRGEPESRSGRVFYQVADLARSARQPFLLVALAGLSVEEAARACNFTEERTVACVERAFRFLERTGLFTGRGEADEL